MIETDTKNDIAFAKKGYKQTKLGLIPEGWSTPTIAEVFEFLSTTSFSRNQLNYEEENDIFYIHYGDIHATYKTPILDFGRNKNVPKLNIDIILPATVQYLKDGDVIIADASEDYEGVGTAIELKNIEERKVISGLHTFALRDKDGLTVEGFRTYIFKNPIVKKALKTIATGSKVFGISKGNLQNFKIVLPSLPEQKKIASILNTWDKAIAAQEKLIAQKQALKKGLMQQLLSGTKRFDGFEEEWKNVKLGDLLTIRNGKDYKHLESGVIPVHGTGGIMTYVNSFLYDGESVGIGRKGTIDKPVYLNGKFWTVDTLFYCNSFRNCIPKYIYFLFQTINWKRYNEASGVPSLSQATIKKIEVVMPNLSEQMKVVEVLSLLDKNIKKLKIEKDSFSNQKQGLIQQLLTGEKRVKI